MLALLLLVALVSLTTSFSRLGLKQRHAVRSRSLMGMVATPTNSVPLSTRVKEAAVKKFSPQGDVSRIVKCWEDFVGGKSMDRYLDGDAKEIRQTAECFVEGLRAICFHDVEDFSWIPGLEAKADVILDELTEYEYRRREGTSKKAFKKKGMVLDRDFIQTIKPSGDGGEGDGEWLGPRDTTGNDYGPDWKTLGLQDRSVWSEELREEFPETIRALESNGVPSCEVFFAKQGANSGLLPHSDKNNFIITCHLGLDVPEGDCHIQVGNEKYYWKNGKTCIFDTSIFHQTRNDSDRVRYVLLIRFWHPDLTQLEIDMFKFIFDYLDHASLGDEALEMFEMQVLMGKDQHKGLQTTAGAMGGGGKKNKSASFEEDIRPKKAKKKSTGGGGFGAK